MTPPKLLDEDNYFIQVDIEFARYYGVNEAMMAGKLKRLQEKLQGKTDSQGNKWVRLTLLEWEKELPIKGMTIRRTIESLVTHKVFLSRTFAGRSKWYRLNPVSVQNEQIQPDATVQNEHTDCSKCTDTTVQNEQLPIVLSNSPLPIKERDSLSKSKDTTDTTIQEFIQSIQSLVGWNPKTNGGVPMIAKQQKRLDNLCRWLIQEANATYSQIQTAAAYFAEWMKTPPTPEQVQEHWARIVQSKPKGKNNGTSKSKNSTYGSKGNGTRINSTPDFNPFASS